MWIGRPSVLTVMHTSGRVESEYDRVHAIRAFEKKTRKKQEKNKKKTRKKQEKNKKKTRKK
jgi:hypothetical protein